MISLSQLAKPNQRLTAKHTAHLLSLLGSDYDPVYTSIQEPRALRQNDQPVHTVVMDTSASMQSVHRRNIIKTAPSLSLRSEFTVAATSANNKRNKGTERKFLV